MSFDILFKSMNVKLIIIKTLFFLRRTGHHTAVDQMAFIMQKITTCNITLIFIRRKNYKNNIQKFLYFSPSINEKVLILKVNILLLINFHN